MTSRRSRRDFQAHGRRFFSSWKAGGNSDVRGQSGHEQACPRAKDRETCSRS